MPYIKSDYYVRASLEPVTSGELNYAMTMQAIFYFMGQITLEDFGEKVGDAVDGFLRHHGVSYNTYNNMIGALTCCGWELVRRAWCDFPLYASEQTAQERLAHMTPG